MKPTKQVELQFYELFDIVTKHFDTVEDALLYYKKYQSKRRTKEKKYKVNWFGGEYRFWIPAENAWSVWFRI